MLCVPATASVMWLRAAGTAEESFGISVSRGVAYIVLEQLWPLAVLVGL